VYAGIDQIVLTESLRAAAVCDVLEVSRSGFYAWRSQEESLREKDDQQLGPVIGEIFWRHRRRYGARRIAVELWRRGLACGVARVTRLLKTRGLQAIQPKSYRPRSTESRHRLGYNANLLMDHAAPEKINEVWVGDITYIPLGARTRESRFGYLALLMDLYSRRIVGWWPAPVGCTSRYESIGWLMSGCGWSAGRGAAEAGAEAAHARANSAGVRYPSDMWGRTSL
jgi:putative transposase